MGPNPAIYFTGLLVRLESIESHHHNSVTKQDGKIAFQFSRELEGGDQLPSQPVDYDSIVA